MSTSSFDKSGFLKDLNHDCRAALDSDSSVLAVIVVYTKGGGLVVYYRSDLPIRRIRTLECEKSRAIILEIKLKKKEPRVYLVTIDPKPQMIMSLN